MSLSVLKWSRIVGQASATASRRNHSTSAATSTTKKRVKSLALTTYFKIPEKGMKKHAVLSRGSAFLMGIDPFEVEEVDDGNPYGHLEITRREREMRRLKADTSFTPMNRERKPMETRWLEWMPREHRPNVHVVAASHVVAPFLWRDYYPHEWLAHLKEEHCTYALEVLDPSKPEKALCKLALRPCAFHHPEGMDIALLYLENEEQCLKILHSYGVDTLYLRDREKLFKKGDNLIFDGYVVSEQSSIDEEELFDKVEPTKFTPHDSRVFLPYTTAGKLSFHSTTSDRFYAVTPEPLQEGLCGGPVLDKDGDLCGSVLGIVPVSHENVSLAGSAVFIPSPVIEAFVDVVERWMLQQMMPKQLFARVAKARETGSVTGRPTNVEEDYNETLEALKSQLKPEDFKDLLSRLESKKEEAMARWDAKGGNIKDIIHDMTEPKQFFGNDVKELIHEIIRKQKEGKS